MRREDADDLRSKWPAVDNYFADDGRIAAKSALKILVTENGDSGKFRRRRRGRLRGASRRSGLGNAVGIREIAAVLEPGAYERKEVRGDGSDADLLWRAVLARENDAAGENARHVVEDVFGAVAHVDVIGIGKWKIANVAIAHIAASDDETIGVLIRERAQEDGIHDAEDGSAGAYTEGDGERGGNRKDRTLTKSAAREDQVS